MNIDFHIKIAGHRIRFYKRSLCGKMVFSIYVDGNSVWQEVTELRCEATPPRCGTCANCRTAITDKALWSAKYRDAFRRMEDLSLPADQRHAAVDEAEGLRREWKARAQQLPCQAPPKD